MAYWATNVGAVPPAVDGLADGLIEGDMEGDRDALNDRLIDGDIEGLIDGERDGLIEADGETDAETDGLIEGDNEAEGLTDGEIEGDCDGEIEVETDGDKDAEGLTEGEADGPILLLDPLPQRIISRRPRQRCLFHRQTQMLLSIVLILTHSKLHHLKYRWFVGRRQQHPTPFVKHNTETRRLVRLQALV